MVKEEQNLIGIVNATGFPLQSAIEAVARKQEDKHYWYFLDREHPWKHPDTAQTRFIDLILGGHRQNGAVVRVRAVIECNASRGLWFFYFQRQVD